MNDKDLIDLCQNITSNQEESLALGDVRQNKNSEEHKKIGELTAAIEIDLSEMRNIKSSGLIGCAAKAAVYLMIPSEGLATSIAEDLVSLVTAVTVAA